MENRVKQIERWETSDGRWFELLTAAHDHQEKLVDMADEIDRLQHERDELKDHNDKLRDVVQDALCDMTLKCMDSTRSKLQAVRGVRIDQLPSPAQWEAVCKNEQMLQAIVAKLPRCNRLNTDKTALEQTCPVVPGMTVFAVRRGCVVEKHRIVEFVVYVIDPTTIGDCDRLRFQAADCYDSLEAAEFAKD